MAGIGAVHGRVGVVGYAVWVHACEGRGIGPPALASWRHLQVKWAGELPDYGMVWHNLGIVKCSVLRFMGAGAPDMQSARKVACSYWSELAATWTETRP